MVDQLTDEECRLKLKDIYEGRSGVIPVDVEHATFMLRMAQFYIDQNHESMMKTLKQENRV